MKCSIVLASAVIFAGACHAVQPATLSEIVEYMATNDYRKCFALTNSLDILTAASTDAMERASCKLLKASILFDHSENMACNDTFVDATNLCREIEVELSGTSVWHRIGALSIFSNAMIDDNRPEVAFVASTNLLATFQFDQCNSVDTNVWNVLFKSGGLNLMPLRDYVRANVAISQYVMNRHADLSAYTNGLPVEIISEISGGGQ